ncbi:unnamed protein product [Timema podura]|uniref:BRK domain-containing protein n=1 Tax=Timema podura TaxID=61482 RepID=A0ABN7NT54_TIMPD|nr:unnamed protein product [Timema podura]
MTSDLVHAREVDSDVSVTCFTSRQLVTWYMLERRSTPVTQVTLQPPPAHQQSQCPRVLSMPFDLKYHSSPKNMGPTVIPGTSSTLTPIDLSSGLPKMGTPDIPKGTSMEESLNEVQDFSMPSKSKQKSSKLDDMLGKLMKKNNCFPRGIFCSMLGLYQWESLYLSSNKLKINKERKRVFPHFSATELEIQLPAEEPVVGKEKKRRKLDEIVLGLSAAKEQKSLFSDMKKSAPNITSISPSVTVTPTSINSALGGGVSLAASTSPSSSNKPFTITVTSVPSPAPPGGSRGGMGLMPSLPTPKESFSSFLAHAEQQKMLLKKQQQQHAAAAAASLPSLAQSHRKTYESMIADLSKVADFSSKINSYSHEAKVNKWLAEQTSLMPEQPLASDYLSAPRRRRPRVDPSLLDWKKLTGEENVSVINRITGKKITGNKAPQLKRLAQWLLENPMFDVDPKWADLVKERGNLPHDLQQQRLPPMERKKGPGRPPLLASPPGQTPSVSQANLATSMASSMSFPSLATAGLSGLSAAAGLNPSSLLSGLSLGGFDPKNNPLLLPFGGMPNMSALGGMSGLGNLGNMGNMSLTNSLFANLAGLGLPSLAGMDGSDMGGNSVPSSSSKGKSRKSSDTDRSHSSSKPPPVSSASSNLPSSALPFFFPNPSLLYTPLGLGGLNPFSMQPGAMSSAAYDSLAQQCGLLNGGLGVSSASTPTSQSTSSRTSGSHKAQSSSRASTVTSSSAAGSSSANHRHQRVAMREALDRQQQQQLQQLLLPHDTHLLESLSRATSMEAALRSEKRARDAERKEAADALRSEKRAREAERKDALESMSRNSVLDFVSRPDERPSKKSKGEMDRKELVDSLTRNYIPEIPTRTEDWLTKNAREAEMKEALENLCRTSAELLVKTAEAKSMKRSRDIVMKEALEGLAKNSVEVSRSEERPFKRPKDTEPKEVCEKPDGAEEMTKTPLLVTPSSVGSVEGPVDIETLIQPSTVTKSGASVPVTPPAEELVPAIETVSAPEAMPVEEQSLPVESKEEDKCVSPSVLAELDASSSGSAGGRATRSGSSGGGRKARGNKRAKQAVAKVDEVDNPPVEKKVLRSSAGRAAAAAAARAAAAAKAEERKELDLSDNTKDNSNKTAVEPSDDKTLPSDKTEDAGDNSEA